MSRVVAKGMIVFAGLAALVLVTGCSASRSRANRTKVLEAEIIDARQQNEGLKDQLAGANRSVDEASSELQQQRFEKEELARKYASSAKTVEDFAARASSAETKAEVNERRTAELESRVDRLLEIRKRDREALIAAQKRNAVRRRTHDTPTLRGDEPQLTAMKGQLKTRMAAAGIHMPVEIRTARDGSRRVAVVLPDSFKAGKASLAYNPTAVNAVVRLGQLVQTQYPGSAVSVEGHTDADPIRRSPWASNEALSLARAKEVQKLLADTGLESSKIAIAGLGAAQPIERGSTARAKSRNRRVEIFINPK